MHRAERIAVAIEELAMQRGFTLLEERTDPLHEDDYPAVVLFQGDDQPLPDSKSSTFIDASLQFKLYVLAKRSKEMRIREQLSVYRSAFVQAVMSSNNLGLDYVIDIEEGTANQIIYNSESNNEIGSQLLEFTVQYRRLRNNPEDS